MMVVLLAKPISLTRDRDDKCTSIMPIWRSGGGKPQATNEAGPLNWLAGNRNASSVHKNLLAVALLAFQFGSAMLIAGGTGWFYYGLGCWRMWRLLR
ncbi:hypothetical protein N825_00650 [Skermanella stibiiresistens SB22]|uniref:Uncharacterized protein n=2 Tax=Skermanella TaxID=204447 RepID=W9HDM5_9PROT|nr:hypothetical protein N825_00650 [Skermanella stibiiresistens SB22]